MSRSGAGRQALLGALILAACLGQPVPSARAAVADASRVAPQSADVVLAGGLRALNAFAALAQVALSQNDIVAARAAYAQFDQGWDNIDDGVRDRSRDAY